ncbi:hypothetical protein AHAS_Ahas15G0303300 [Arachis hypogaea]
MARDEVVVNMTVLTERRVVVVVPDGGASGPYADVGGEEIWIDRLKHKRDIGLALEYFKSLANSGAFKHTEFTYQLMIEKLGENGEMDGIPYLLQQMKLEGVACSEDFFICGEGLEPNGFTYNMLLKALCKNGKMDGACKLLEEMSNKGCPLNAVSYTTVVSSVCKLGQVEKAKEQANGFAPGIDPNVISYSTIINCLFDMENIELSLVSFAQMLKKECNPNIHTYSSLIKGCLLGGKLGEALELWNLMIMEGVKSNVVLYKPSYKVFAPLGIRLRPYLFVIRWRKALAVQM